MTQGNIYKKDDSAITTNESKINNNSLLNKLAYSAENDKK